MTHIFIGPNNEYPRHIGDVLIEHPDWDGTLNSIPNGWSPVTPTEPPAVHVNQIYYEVTPTVVDGKYMQTWEVRDLTAEEIKQRDEYLASFSTQTLIENN